MNVYLRIYTKIDMICKVIKIDLLDSQGFSPFYFRKSILVEHRSPDKSG
jgi:hypothetical protein